MAKHWDPVNTSYTSRYGCFVIANDDEWVALAGASSSSNAHLLEFYSTDKGENWTRYDTGIDVYATGFPYDAVADDVGVVHVFFAGRDVTLGWRMMEVTRTAAGTWTAPTNITDYAADRSITEIACKKSLAGEIAVVWLQYLEWGSYVAQARGKKWTSEGGWDANITDLTTAGLGLYDLVVTYSSSGTIMFAAIVAAEGANTVTVRYWTWGSTTSTIVISSTESNAVIDCLDIIVTGSTPHVAYTLNTIGSGWGNELPWILWVDSTCVDIADSITGLARFATKVNGSQALYYFSFLQGDAANQLRVKRCALTNGVPGTPAEYTPIARVMQYDQFTFPEPMRNIEGLGCVTGYWTDISSSMSIVILKEAELIEATLHSFPWVGRFQLSKA
jgi:hypothetical protein